MAGCNLIVHADDLGLSKKVNEGILQAHSKGIVTSASIIPTGRAFDHAIEICRSTPSLDLGIHLTLVEEKPVLSNMEIPSLIGTHGRFAENFFRFAKMYYCGEIDFSEVGKELEAQIRKVLDLGLPISHLDSHQHIHMLPKIRKIVVELARKYRIPALRYPCEGMRPYMFGGKRASVRVSHVMILKVFCFLGKNENIRRPDNFCGFFFGGRLTEENLRTVLQNLPEFGTCELMCHPGLRDPESPYEHWNYNHEEEFKALTSGDILRQIQKCGIRLISFWDLQ